MVGKGQYFFDGSFSMPVSPSNVGGVYQPKFPASLPKTKKAT
jgi:hypothetical protein